MNQEHDMDYEHLLKKGEVSTGVSICYFDLFSLNIYVSRWLF
jgi:hypothetical protein